MITTMIGTPLMTIVGTAVGITAIEKALARFGHGDLVPMIGLIGWGVAGYITLDWYMTQVHTIGGVFR